MAVQSRTRRCFSPAGPGELALTVPRDIAARLRSWRPARRPSGPVLLRLGLVAVLVVAVIAGLAAATYHVPRGTVTFSVRPAWPGGRLVMPLGPAGEFALHTHRTPLDITMVYQLPDVLGSLGPGDLEGTLPSLQASARDAFGRYLLSRIPWLLLAAAAAGGLVAGTGRGRRRLILGAAGGAAAVVVLAGGLALVTLATVDRSPAVEYRGLARNVTRVLPLVRALGSGDGQSDGLSRLADFVDGLESVATQLTRQAPDPGARARDPPAARERCARQRLRHACRGAARGGRRRPGGRRARRRRRDQSGHARRGGVVPARFRCRRHAGAVRGREPRRPARPGDVRARRLRGAGRRRVRRRRRERPRRERPDGVATRRGLRPGGAGRGRRTAPGALALPCGAAGRAAGA